MEDAESPNTLQYKHTEKSYPIVYVCLYTLYARSLVNSSHAEKATALCKKCSMSDTIWELPSSIYFGEEFYIIRRSL